jgi:hypothetical protein
MALTSFFLSPKLIGSALLGVGFGLSPVAAAPVCKPALTFKDVRFSPIQHETMERTWSATLAVDASRCATTSGRFELLFSRLKENAPEVDFTEAFIWKAESVEVSVNFWADEAVEAYWLHNVAACPCRD